MHKLPAETKLMGGKTRTRFDDFLALHISLTDEIHGVGQFLPWHRRYLQVYEQTLREKCGYKGAQPYWDQSLDVNNFPGSPVFDPVFGFGGNGVDVPGSSGPWNNLSFVGGFTGGGCVTDGPFAHFNLSVGPGTTATNHCLTRGFNTVALNFIGPASVALMYNDTTFAMFRKDLEGTPSADSFRIHDGGHLAVAGEMCDRYSSPADPLFFLHHANLDRHWWQWQKLDLSHRLTDISGQSSVDPPFKNVTLDYQLKMDVLAPLVPIRNVMDVRSLCYNYV
jgi:tyrosinase